MAIKAQIKTTPKKAPARSTSKTKPTTTASKATAKKPVDAYKQLQAKYRSLQTTKEGWFKKQADARASKYQFLAALYQFSIDAIPSDGKTETLEKLYQANHVKIEKDPKNIWTMLITLVLGEDTEQNTKSKAGTEGTKTVRKIPESKKGYYRYANVIRWLHDEKVKPTSAADRIADETIEGIVDKDKARHTDADAVKAEKAKKALEAKTQALDIASKKTGFGTISGIGRMYNPGFVEMVGYLDTKGKLQVLAITDRSEDNVVPSVLKYKQRIPNNGKVIDMQEAKSALAKMVEIGTSARSSYAAPVQDSDVKIKVGA